MNKFFFNVTMAALLGMILGGCDTDSIIGEDDDDIQTSNRTFYLKDSNGAGVTGIAYSCIGGSNDAGDLLVTSGNTASAGDMPIVYAPVSQIRCTLTPIDAPKLYLYDANGPMNDVSVYCNSSNGFTGEDGHAGSINNAPSDTCVFDIFPDNF